MREHKNPFKKELQLTLQLNREGKTLTVNLSERDRWSSLSKKRATFNGEAAVVAYERIAGLCLHITESVASFRVPMEEGVIHMTTFNDLPIMAEDYLIGCVEDLQKGKDPAE